MNKIKRQCSRICRLIKQVKPCWSPEHQGKRNTEHGWADPSWWVWDNTAESLEDDGGMSASLEDSDLPREEGITV